MLPPPTVFLNPLVPMNIVDHWQRRNEDQTKVIGVLLGSRADGAVHIRNSFPLPVTEAEDSISIDVEYQRIMYELHLRAENGKNVMVGWYCTAYTEHAQQLHEFYAKKLQDPIHLLVDPSLKGGVMNIKTLVSRELKLKQEVIGQVFKEVKFEYSISHAEKSAIDAMTGTKLQDDGADAAAEEGEVSVEELRGKLSRLAQNLTRVQSYVTGVVSGQVPEDTEIGRALWSIVCSVPNMEPEEFERAFNGATQDMLSVMYLSKLIKTQLLLAEQIVRTQPAM